MVVLRYLYFSHFLCLSFTPLIHFLVIGVLFLDELLMALLTGTYVPMYSARHYQDSFKVKSPNVSFQLIS